MSNTGKPVLPKKSTMSPKVTSKELDKLAEELFEKLPNILYDNKFCNYQEKIGRKCINDMSPEQLFDVPQNVLKEIPTIKLLYQLYDNYNLSTSRVENHTEKEEKEENDFISALLETDIMLHAMNFLANKGIIKPGIEQYRRILKLLWFHPSSLNATRKHIMCSSGFENVFLAEKRRDNKVYGFHNWIYFVEQEKKGRVNYLGHTGLLEFNETISLGCLVFTFDGIKKKSTMFIGTPPEFELALYTICYFVNPEENCRFNLRGKNFGIMTHKKDIAPNHSMIISSAQPVI